ncbi:PIN domain-containing protein [Granulicella sp. dw_53]|uniref:type II toxin-antitoxin system VapC family toxin n=1 Tax=Granulicella sp. dw_53 TaxID=2719792 RepID=UPI001BD63105
MILIDTSVWVDHLRAGDDAVKRLLETGQVLSHPFVIGELAMGSLKQREVVLGALQDLPKAAVASEDEVLGFIRDRSLFGVGIGYIDAHLMTAVQLTPDALLWTRDRRLAEVAARLASGQTP